MEIMVMYYFQFSSHDVLKYIHLVKIFSIFWVEVYALKTQNPQFCTQEMYDLMEDTNK